jgi:hypothetical protein
MYLTLKDHTDRIHALIQQKPAKIYIATYGVYAGILPDGRYTNEWGQKYTNDIGKILEAIPKTTEVQILVGINDYASCNKRNCQSCEINYTKQLIRLINHAEKWPNYQWKYTANMHLKCFIALYGPGEALGITGGRNFTNSTWEDVTLDIQKQEIAQIMQLYVKIWQKALPINDKNIANTLKNQGINPKTLETISNLNT